LTLRPNLNLRFRLDDIIGNQRIVPYQDMNAEEQAEEFTDKYAAEQYMLLDGQTEVDSCTVLDQEVEHRNHLGVTQSMAVTHFQIRQNGEEYQQNIAFHKSAIDDGVEIDQNLLLDRYLFSQQLEERQPPVPIQTNATQCFLGHDQKLNTDHYWQTSPCQAKTNPMSKPRSRNLASCIEKQLRSD